MRALAAAAVLLLFAAPARAAEPAPAPELDPRTTWAVVAGVLEWKDARWNSFAKEDRKDRELYELLGKRGVPEAQRVLLLDEQATTANVTAALRRMVAAAPPGATLLFYFAGHGDKDRDGEVVFATYDADADLSPGSGLQLTELRNILASFKGERLLLAADCCHSGELVRVAESLHDRGLRAAALTSADAANVSTANWTYTQTLIDGLAGRDLEDRDDDGRITLGELARDVGDAMRHREFQRYGWAAFDVPEELVLARTAPPRERLDAGAGGYRRRAWVLAPLGKSRAPAQILGARDGRLRVAFYGYATERDAWVAPRKVAPMTFTTYPVGAALDVVWEGRVYEAHVLKVDDGFHYITYPGYRSSWDEWVMADRIVGLHTTRR